MRHARPAPAAATPRLHGRRGARSGARSGSPATRAATADVREATALAAVAEDLPRPIADPVESAAAAGLRYVSDATPGIRRKRAGHGFVYVGPDGRRIGDAAVLRRIRSLVIPPAWRDVWICPRADGHIQAVGRDARGRKQYRYHPGWRALRDANKYERLALFASRLPRIRRRVARDLARRGLSRERVLATIVRLLETTFARIGNDEYARTNGSFGLTTLRNRHARVSTTTVRLRFRGKSGKEHEVAVSDRRIAAIVRRCQDLPGQELFQYVDDDGAVRSIDSSDVNAYLREASGEDFTAKDFRTWAGTLLAAVALRDADGDLSQARAKKAVAEAIATVARQLGNTPTVCRACYVHPGVIEAFHEGRRLAGEDGASPALVARGLSGDERALLELLLAARRRRKAAARATARAAS
ncbi:MAG TPA: DNA topoisomerase IB [Candidatus Binatia bacterium]|nr:DNA topoisomerase IB [Candidatus Binatia bacterium]